MWESAEQRPITFCDFERTAVAQEHRVSSLLHIPIGSVDRLANARACLAAGETQADVARTYNVDAATIGRLA
jgi:hypothetical protein